MEDLFNNIESDKLSDARETLASTLGSKVADAIDAMRKEIASKLTKEGIDEGKIGKKMAKMFTDLKKEKHAKIKEPHKQLSDEEMEHARDDFYKGCGKVGEDLEEDNTPNRYQDRMYVSDKPAPKNSNTVGKSKKEKSLGKTLDALFKQADKNTIESRKNGQI